MSNYDNITVHVVKKTTSVFFSDFNEREKKFAKKYAEKYDTKLAYDHAFSDITNVRASSLLQNTELWELVLNEIKKKHKKNPKEKELLSEYQNYKDNFDISPLEAYRYFVDENDGQTIASKLQTDCCNAFKFLVFAYPFFEILEREFFLKNITESIRYESEQIDAQGRKSEKIYISKKAKENGICVDEIIG